MSQFRLARISMMVAALGLNVAPALMTGAHAQAKPAAPAADAPKPDTLRPELFKLIDPTVINQLKADKKFAEIQDRVTQADALPAKTPFESYILERTRLSLAMASSNSAMAITSLESVIASGRLTPAEQANFIQALGVYYYEAKNYPKAIETFKRYQKESPTPGVVSPALVRAYYLSGDYANAKTVLLPLLAEAEKTGQTPSQEDLRLLATSAQKVKDDASYVMALEKLATFYPTDEIWTDLSNRVVRKQGYNQKLDIDVYRLKNASIKAMAPEEYADMAELSLAAGLPTEAKKTLDAGFAAGVLGTGSNAAKHKQLRDKANKGAADDAKNIASGEAGALKAKDGTGMVNLGYAYVTMDQFDKGIGLMEKGIAKGGMKQPDEARLRLGVAYAKAGRKADALKTFDGLKSSSGGIAELARYWSLWLNRPAATAAAPAAAVTK